MSTPMPVIRVWDRNSRIYVVSYEIETVTLTANFKKAKVFADAWDAQRSVAHLRMLFPSGAWDVAS